MTQTLLSRRVSLRLAGRVLQLLEACQPSPMTAGQLARRLSCNKGTLRGALKRLVEIEAVAIDPETRLVTLLDREVNLEPTPEPQPEPPIQVMPDAQERLLHAAILRRAEACVRAGHLHGAVELLNRAAERSRPAVAINFLVIADLYGAGHRRYPDVPEREAEQLRRRSGFITGAEIQDALAGLA